MDEILLQMHLGKTLPAIDVRQAISPSNIDDQVTPAHGSIECPRLANGLERKDRDVRASDTGFSLIAPIDQCDMYVDTPVSGHLPKNFQIGNSQGPNAKIIVSRRMEKKSYIDHFPGPHSRLFAGADKHMRQRPPGC
jgi:hypothetical protein